MRRIVVANRKGGVGKTSLSLNIAALAAEQGHRVLFVDLDPQASATLSLMRGDPAPEQSTSLGLLRGLSVLPLASPVWAGIDVLSASSDLSDAESMSVPDMRAALATLPALYDIVVFDTPPADSLLQLLPMLDAHIILSPIEADTFALAGLSALQADVTRIRGMGNSFVRHVAVINRLTSRSSRQAALVLDLRGIMHATLLPAELRSREIVRQSRDKGVPVWTHAPNDPASQAWKAVCAAVLH